MDKKPAGVMEYWSVGVMDKKNNPVAQQCSSTPIRHHSNVQPYGTMKEIAQ
jgi:hypothetical protein